MPVAPWRLALRPCRPTICRMRVTGARRMPGSGSPTGRTEWTRRLPPRRTKSAWQLPARWPCQCRRRQKIGRPLARPATPGRLSPTAGIELRPSGWRSSPRVAPGLAAASSAAPATSGPAAGNGVEVPRFAAEPATEASVDCDAPASAPAVAPAWPVVAAAACTMAAASESGVTVGVAAGSPVAGSAVADASSRRSDAGFAGGDAFWSSRSRDLAGTPATRVAGQPFAEPVSGPSTAAGVSGSGVAVDGSGLGGAGMPPAVARDPWAFGAGRCAACWAACWTASSASPNPARSGNLGPSPIRPARIAVVPQRRTRAST